MGRLFRGRFETPRQVWTWVLLGFAASTALAATAIHYMPDDTELHPFRTCVSHVGSFNAEYNPDGFRWFSASLILMAAVMAPLVLYRHRRMSLALGRSHRMRILSTLVMIGVVGYMVTGLIPMGRDKLIGHYTWDNVHDVAAKCAFICFGSGLLVEGTVLLFKRRRLQADILPFRTLIRPYLFVTAIVSCAVFFLLSWDIKRAADPTLRWTGEGLYAFALWEWVMFLTGPIVVAWIALAWIHEPEQPAA
jgi:hypothetical protein